ncbi:MAG: S1 RNA-binding domain-containing protein [Bacteroides xylanisolvens]
MNEIIKIILLCGFTSVFSVLAWIYLSGEVWAKGKIILGDILRLIGWTNKNVRKLSVKSEYEGTINSIIQDYNKNFENPILPNCKIEWVEEKNINSVLKENEAIVCLSFDKRDHNLNFYNAILNFVQIALIAKAKDYLKRASSEAIDLLTTHIILRNNRKEVLTTFRKKFNDFEETTRQEFEALVPTNDRGLFLNILLPEFYFYGELIDSLPPSSEYNIEANGLLQWFKELASREIDERTNLKCISKNFKIGVILVGKDETWEKFGASAYIKWADYYAAENYNSVYVLGRGNSGYERASEVVRILTNSKGFDQINKNPKIKCASAEGKEYIVTCFSLRPNRATIAYLAWESLRQYYSEEKNIPAIIDNVQKECIVINAFGLKFEIPNKLLSTLEIKDARKIFHSEDEMFLSIKELDVDRQYVILSNQETESDPKHYIETVIKGNKIYLCTIERVQKDKQGIQTGLKVSNKDLKSWVYIPKPYLTYSRFLDLEAKYLPGDYLNIIIEKYSPSSSNFVGKIDALNDPWEESYVKKMQVGDIVEVVVKQINEFYVVCELQEGVECFLVKQEISWNHQECITSQFKVDEIIKVCIISIDSDRRRINISIKRLSKTPELEYFENNLGQIVDVEIAYNVPEKGIAVKYMNNEKTGFIWWTEIAWGAVGHFENIYKQGDKIKAVVIDFDSEKNNIKFSIKSQYIHQFEEWNKIIDDSYPVQGQIIAYLENSVHVELVEKNCKVQSFLPRKEISNIAFIGNEDLQYYLPIGDFFSFFILEVNESRKTIALTRKEYLEQSEYPNYGEKIQVKYVKENHTKGYFYSEELEGWTNIPESNITMGSLIKVTLLSSSTGEYTIIE